MMIFIHLRRDSWCFFQSCSLLWNHSKICETPSIMNFNGGIFPIQTSNNSNWSLFESINVLIPLNFAILIFNESHSKLRRWLVRIYLRPCCRIAPCTRRVWNQRDRFYWKYSRHVCTHRWGCLDRDIDLFPPELWNLHRHDWHLSGSSRNIFAEWVDASICGVAFHDNNSQYWQYTVHSITRFYFALRRTSSLRTFYFFTSFLR